MGMIELSNNSMPQGHPHGSALQANEHLQNKEEHQDEVLKSPKLSIFRI